MIKPIETVYNGYHFRSRLEARWAVFFDVMGIKYLYEHEGFEVTVGPETFRYLPDFYFPDYDMFGEVKPVTCRGKISPKDAEKMSWMVDYNAPCANGIVLLGLIPEPSHAAFMTWAIMRWHKGIWYQQTYATFDGDVLWEDYGAAPWVFDKDDDIIVTNAIYSEYVQESLAEKALTAARQARFEHRGCN